MRKNKPVIVPIQGKEFSCSANRLEYIWPGKVIPNEKEALAYLSERSEKASSKSAVIELDVIHELCEVGVPYTLDDLAENFLDDPENGWSRVSLLIRIKNDQKHFQQKKNQFVARSSAEIQKLEEETEKILENERKLQKEQDWAEKLRKRELPEITTEDTDHWNLFLHRILNFLHHLDSSQEKDYLSTLFQCQTLEPVVTERRLLDVLSLAGINMSWGYLILSRVNAHASIEQGEMAAISELKTRDIQNGIFSLDTKDDTGLTTYTVDNADTRDYDDAVSLELIEDGAVLRVHIADVASFIQRESLLFQKGENRISSLYTVKETYPMFHPDLSENVFSLKEGADRPVLTFEAKVDENGALMDSRIYRSIVNVKRNLTYEAVDDAINREDIFWKRVWQICRQMKEKRIENGSLELDRIEVKLDISDPSCIQIKEIRENTPANSLIEELAIFANHLAASFCKQHNLLCLYRNQPPYSLNRELAEGEKPTLGDIHIQPARIGTIPEGHSALGLHCYMQVTSPIRRFLDLVNQGILFSKLATVESGYTSDDLLNWARLGEEVQREYAFIEKRLLDHWKIKYLEQHREEVFDAQLIRTLRNGRSLIRILKIQLVVECVADKLPADSFRIVLDQVISKYDRVIARPYLNSLPESNFESNEPILEDD